MSSFISECRAEKLGCMANQRILKEIQSLLSGYPCLLLLFLVVTLHQTSLAGSSADLFGCGVNEQVTIQLDIDQLSLALKRVNLSALCMTEKMVRSYIEKITYKLCC